MGVLIVIIRGIIWGFVAKKIIENKGYNENWFWWGFFFGIIAVIVACTKPQNYDYTVQKVASVNINNIEELKATPSYNSVIQNKSKKIPEKVDINSVINIEEYEILCGSDASVFLKIRMKNVGNQSIRALKMHISGSNTFREKILFNDKEYFEVMLQDLNFAVDAEITHKFELADNQKDIRHFEFWVSQVCYSNDEIFKCKEPFYIKTCQEVVDLKYLSFVQNTIKDAKFYMIKYPQGWQCVCGNVNIGDKCSNCGLMLHNAEKFRKDTIEKNYIEYKRLKDEEECRRKEEEQERKEREAEEKRRIVQEKEAERIKKSKIKRIRNTILILLVVIVSALVGYNKVYLLHYSQGSRHVF